MLVDSLLKSLCPLPDLPIYYMKYRESIKWGAKTLFILT